MPRSTIGEGDLRDIDRFVGELREMKTRPVELYAHMLDGLMRIVGADASATSPTRECVPGGAAFCDSLIVRGFTRDSERRIMLDGIGPAVVNDPAIAEMLPLNVSGRVVTRLRRELVTDGIWSRSPYGDQMVHEAGVVDLVYSSAPSDRPGDVFGIGLVRTNGSRFGEVERDLLHAFHQAMVHVYPSLSQRPPLSATLEAARRLAPRHRATLRLLLTGIGEKAVAARLGLSRHTVHDYVREISLHLGVESRAELLARFIPPNAFPE